jgi:hypothetical protein
VRRSWFWYHSHEVNTDKLLSNKLHDLILGQVRGLRLHSIIVTRCQVLDRGQSEGSTAVLVPRELFDRSVSALGSVKSDDTSSSGAAIWLILNFSLLDLADGGE